MLFLLYLFCVELLLGLLLINDQLILQVRFTFISIYIICLLAVSDLSSCITSYIVQNNAMYYMVHRLIFYDSN